MQSIHVKVFDDHGRRLIDYDTVTRSTSIGMLESAPAGSDDDSSEEFATPPEDM